MTKHEDSSFELRISVIDIRVNPWLNDRRHGQSAGDRYRGSYFCILSSSFPSAFTWAGRKKTSKTSHSAVAAIPWWAVLASIIAAETSAGTFFGTPGEGFSAAQLHILAARLRHNPRHAFSSATFSSSLTTTTKFIRSTNISPRASACRRKTRHPLFSWLRACWRPVRACM